MPGQEECGELAKDEELEIVQKSVGIHARQGAHPTIAYICIWTWLATMPHWSWPDWRWDSVNKYYSAT